jgi:hypothetical protein
MWSQMESTVRCDSRTKINLASFYANIQRGKDCSTIGTDESYLNASYMDEIMICSIL